MKRLSVIAVLMLVMMVGVLSFNMGSYHQKASYQSSDHLITGSTKPWPWPTTE